MILTYYDRDKAVAGAPRICGDDPTFLSLISMGTTCSPHLRG